MNRQQKELVVESLKDNFAQKGSSFLVGYKGLSVAQMQKLRKNLRQEGASLQVAKWRLMKKAAFGLESNQALMPFFKNQIAVVFTAQDTGATARILSDFAKNNKELSLVACMMENTFLDSATVVRLASLPSREVLLARLCGALNAPIANFVYVLDVLRKRSSEIV